jgi:hypothetical protein
MKQKTIDMLKAKAASYEAAAQADNNAPYADGYRQVASMFLEAIGKADNMGPLDFADYANRCVFAAYQWEDTMGPDAYVPEYQYDTP